VTPFFKEGRAPARVAVVRMSAIGDCVRAMPVVASLRQAWPQTHITWVIQAVPKMLMAGRPDVDEFLEFRRSLGLGAYADLRRRLGDRSYDLVINLHPVFKGGLVSRLLPAPLKLGFDRKRASDLSWLGSNRRVPARPTAHVQDEFFEFLQALDIPIVQEWDFHFTEDERRQQAGWLETFDRPILAVAIRSAHAEKDWILARHARVIDVARREFGLEAVLVGGPSTSEGEDAARLAQMCATPPRVEMHRDLRRLAWVLDASALVLGPDTGPLHMAVALGRPTIGLYGYTDPKRHGPYGRFADLTIDRFTRGAETEVSREKRNGNMSTISETDVLEKIEFALSRYVKMGV